MNPQDIKVGYFVSLIKERQQPYNKHSMVFKKLYRITNVIPFFDCCIIEFVLNKKIVRLVYTSLSSVEYKITTLAEERFEKIKKLFNESE